MPDDPRSTVKSVGKAVAVLRAFDPSRSRPTTIAVANQTGTTLRLIRNFLDTASAA